MLRRPEIHEFAAFQKKYIDLAPDNIIGHLEEQNESFNTFLSQLNPDQLNHKYQEDKWTIKEVAFHIIDTERIFNYRALSIARKDPQALPGFDQDDYVREEFFKDLDLSYLIDFFDITRKSTLIMYKGFNPEQWELSGQMSSYKMGLIAFPYMNAGHLTHHLNIINERYLIQ